MTNFGPFLPYIVKKMPGNSSKGGLDTSACWILDHSFNVTAIKLRRGINLIFDATTNNKWKGAIENICQKYKIAILAQPGTYVN